MTKSRVTELINEHGHCYLDNYVAKEFAATSGQPEVSVLSVLRRQEAACLIQEHGKGKYQRAKEEACMLLAIGWENAEHSQSSPAELLAARELATAYAILARRQVWGNTN